MRRIALTPAIVQETKTSNTPWYKDYPSTSEAAERANLHPTSTIEPLPLYLHNRPRNAFLADDIPQAAPQVIHELSHFIAAETSLRNLCLLHVADTCPWASWMAVANVRGGQAHRIDEAWQSKSHRKLRQEPNRRIDVAASKNIAKAAKDIAGFLKAGSKVSIEGLTPPSANRAVQHHADWAIVSADDLVVHIMTEGIREEMQLEKLWGEITLAQMQHGNSKSHVDIDEWRSYTRKLRPSTAG